MPDGRLITLEELATRLSISYTKARILVLFDHKIPFVKVGVRGIRVRESDLEKYMASLGKQEEATVSKDAEKTTDIREPFRGRELDKDSK